MCKWRLSGTTTATTTMMMMMMMMMGHCCCYFCDEDGSVIYCNWRWPTVVAASVPVGVN